MEETPRLHRLEGRIRRSKRSGKVVLLLVALVSLGFTPVLVQALLLAREAGRSDLVTRAIVGLGVLIGLNLFSWILIRRQHRMLDEAREDLEALISGEPLP